MNGRNVARLALYLLVALLGTSCAREPKLSELRRDLKAKDPSLRAKAAWNVGYSCELSHSDSSLLGPEGEALVNDLCEALLKDEDVKVRQNAAVSLDHLGLAGEKAVPALIQALDDHEPLVRHAAASALGSMGHTAKQAIPALNKIFLQDSDASMREYARLSIIDIER